MFTPPPIDNAAVERIIPKCVRRGRRVDVIPPPIDNAAVERIIPKCVRRGRRVDVHTALPSTTPLRKRSPQNEFEGGGVWISHCPTSTTSLQEEYTPQ